MFTPMDILNPMWSHKVPIAMATMGPRFATGWALLILREKFILFVAVYNYNTKKYMY